MSEALTILALESTCDDTAAAIVCDASHGNRVRSSVVWSQTDLHALYGGVVPEIAARAHAERIDDVVANALSTAGVVLADVDGIAVSAGPGLIGGVLAGVMCAKGIAVGAGLPLIGVNHLAGHALTPRLTDDLEYPYLTLLISGGHCLFIIVRGPDDFSRIGGTIDDAPGEAFDKTARVLGLPQPGGPAIEACARAGDETRIAFPRPLLDRADCDMSFSGLKTALIRAHEAIMGERGGMTEQDRADLAAGFQAAVRDVLAEKSRRAIAAYLEESPSAPAFAVAGGVAANAEIRAALESVSIDADVKFVAPPLALCTDNAAMIGWAGIELMQAGRRDGMDLAARPRWPLDTAQAPMLGSGRRGAKA